MAMPNGVLHNEDMFNAQQLASLNEAVAADLAECNAHLFSADMQARFARNAADRWGRKMGFLNSRTAHWTQVAAAA